jgi:hypothetical protein
MTPEQYLALARMSKATVYTNRHYPLRPAVSFSHGAWLEFCKRLDELAHKSQSVVTDAPVAEVFVSHVRAGVNGMFTAEIESRERLPVGAELFIQPQAARQDEPLADEQVSEIVANHCLNVGDWAKNGASVARAIERAHGIGGKS